jgi:hypothetical protein
VNYEIELIRFGHDNWSWHVWDEANRIVASARWRCESEDKARREAEKAARDHVPRLVKKYEFRA